MRYILLLFACVELFAKPVLIYRQAYLERREESAFYKEEYKDYVDQLYLSLNFKKTVNQVNEIVLEPAIRTVRNNPGTIETSLDQGFIKANLGNWNIIAGKKRTINGSGFFIRPSDLLNEDEEIFDELYQREGKIYSQLNYFFESTSVGVGFIPWQRRTANYGRFWSHLSGQYGWGDVDLQYTYNSNELSTLGFSVAKFFTDNLEIHLDSKYQQKHREVGSDSNETSQSRRTGKFFQPERVSFSCELLKTENLEDQCLIESVEGDFFNSVLGTRFVFTPKRTFIFEWIENQGGMSQEELKPYYLYTAKDSDPDLPPQRLLSQQYLFLGYEDEDTFKSVTTSLSYLHSLSDESFFSSLEFDHAVDSGIHLAATYGVFGGAPFTEFGEQPFSSTVYLKIKGIF